MRALFTFDDPPTEHDLHLSTESSASSYGQPVVVTAEGEAIDQFSWAAHRVIEATDEEVEAFEAAGYPLTWGLSFVVYMPTCPTYWGAACDHKTAELCCREGELAIGAYISERWPGASCEFHRWPNNGGCPRPTVDPEGPQAEELEAWVQRTWHQWASRVIDFGRRADR